MQDARIGAFIRDVIHPKMKELDCHFVICVVTPEREEESSPPIVGGTGSGVVCITHLLSQALADQIRQLHEASHYGDAETAEPP